MTHEHSPTMDQRARTNSQRLESTFRAMSQRMSRVGADMLALRDMTEALQAEASEPQGVTYSELEANGRRSIWCQPMAASGGAIIYFHGGGYIANTPETVRKLVGHLASASGLPALIPSYRLAPEHQFPRQIEDAVAAFDWLVQQGLQPSQIAFAGESAGGNLALATALWLVRERGIRVAGVVGISAWLDLVGEGQTVTSNAATDGFLSREASQMMATMYLGDLAKAADPLVNPAVDDPADMPPMYLSAGGAETQLSAIRSYAERAIEAGVPVVLDVSEGMQHAYPYMAGRATEADRTIAAAGRWLRERVTAEAGDSVQVKPTIVLVHGAWTDSSIWARVADRLLASGHPIRYAQLPLNSFADDVKALSSLLDRITGPVVLVGWSYSGAVITAAGERAHVQSLAYICAAAPDFSETIGELVTRNATSVPFNLSPDEAGFYWLDQAFAAQGLGRGVSLAELDRLVSTQKPIHASFMDASVDQCAWKNRPCVYLVTTEDQALSTATQRSMAAHIGAEVRETGAGHLVLLVQPEVVAQAILRAAELSRANADNPAAR